MAGGSTVAGGEGGGQGGKGWGGSGGGGSGGGRGWWILPLSGGSGGSGGGRGVVDTTSGGGGGWRGTETETERAVVAERGREKKERRATDTEAGSIQESERNSCIVVVAHGVLQQRVLLGVHLRVGVFPATSAWHAQPRRVPGASSPGVVSAGNKSGASGPAGEAAVSAASSIRAGTGGRAPCRPPTVSSGSARSASRAHHKILVI